MATVVADLLARLGLDLSGFREGIQQAGQEAGKLSDSMSKASSPAKVLTAQLEQTRSEMKKMISEGISPADKAFAAIQETYNKQKTALATVKESITDAGKSAGDAARGPFTALHGAFASLGAEGAGLLGRFSGLITGLGGIGIALGALALAAKASTQTLTQLSEQVRDLQYLAGGTPQQISGLVDVVEDLGVSADTVQLAMNRMSQAITTGDPALARLGISIRNSSGQFKTGLQMFYDTIDALHSLRNETERNRAAQEIFGRGWTTMVPLIERGAAALRDAADASDKTITRDDIERTKAYRQATAELGDAVDKLKMTFGRGVIVKITFIAEGVAEFLNGINRSIRAAQEAKEAADLYRKMNIGPGNFFGRPQPLINIMEQSKGWSDVGSFRGQTFASMQRGPAPRPEETIPEAETRLKITSELVKLQSQLTTVMGPVITEEQRYAEELRVTDTNLDVQIKSLKEQEQIEKQLIELRYRKGELGEAATPEAIAAGTLTAEQQQTLKRRADLTSATERAIQRQQENATQTANARRTQINEQHWTHLRDVQLEIERQVYRERENMDAKDLVRIAKHQTDVEALILEGERQTYLNRVRAEEELSALREKYAYLDEPVEVPESPTAIFGRQERIRAERQADIRAQAAIAMGGAEYAPVVDLQKHLKDLGTEASLVGSRDFDLLSAQISATRDAMRSMIQNGIDPSDAKLLELKQRFTELSDLSREREQFRDFFTSISDGLTTSINGVIQGTQTLKQAFANMVQSIALSITNTLIKGALKDLEKSLEDVFFAGKAAQGVTGGAGGSLWGGILAGLAKGASGLFGGGASAGWGAGTASSGFGAGEEATSGLAGYAEGGIVSNPTIAKLAEREPEAILPFSKLRLLSAENRLAVMNALTGASNAAGAAESPQSGNAIGPAREALLPVELAYLTRPTTNAIQNDAADPSASIAAYAGEISGPSAASEAGLPSMASAGMTGTVHANIPGYAEGGIVSTPTVANLAEREPEVVLPMSKLRLLDPETRLAVLNALSGGEQQTPGGIYQTAQRLRSAGVSEDLIRQILGGVTPTRDEGGGGRGGPSVGEPPGWGPMTSAARTTLGVMGALSPVAAFGYGLLGMRAASAIAGYLGVPTEINAFYGTLTPSEIQDVRDYFGSFKAAEAEAQRETAQKQAAYEAQRMEFGVDPATVLGSAPIGGPPSLEAQSYEGTSLGPSGVGAGWGSSTPSTGFGVGEEASGGTGEGRGDTDSDTDSEGGYGGSGSGEGGPLGEGGIVLRRQRAMIAESGPEVRFKLQSLAPSRRQALVDLLPAYGQTNRKLRQSHAGFSVRVPALADGGIISRPTLALLGEGRNPDLVTPLRPSTGPSGQAFVQQVFNVSPGVPEAVRREVRAMMPEIRQHAVDAFVQARNRGGAVARLLGERGK